MGLGNHGPKLKWTSVGSGKEQAHYLSLVGGAQLFWEIVESARQDLQLSSYFRERLTSKGLPCRSAIPGVSYYLLMGLPCIPAWLWQLLGGSLVMPTLSTEGLG